MAGIFLAGHCSLFLPVPSSSAIDACGECNYATRGPVEVIKALRSHRQSVALFSVILVCVVTYLPIVQNFFISDDFGFFRVVEVAEDSPRWFFESTTEFFRLTSYVYFAVCWHLFGLNPAPFYWAGIGLHALVAVLLYLLVLGYTQSSMSAWAAAVFFGAYERHQEAIMWISAANETLLAVNCVAFLLLWKKFADSGSRTAAGFAHFFLALALFSKEASVILAPLAIIQLLMAGSSFRATLRKSAGLIAMTFAFGMLWLVVAHRNFFLTDGHYALSFSFLSVYARAVVRLVTQFLPFLALWLFANYRSGETTGSTRMFSLGVICKSPAFFFATLFLLSVLPYTFLTYSNHIPSRNTYLPSIGISALLGIVFAAVFSLLTTTVRKAVVMSLFSLLVVGNGAYIWLKKVPQFEERAAPTLQLIAVLNKQEATSVPIHVCNFPEDSWTFTEAVVRFTRFKAEDVILDSVCDRSATAIMSWDQASGKYIASFQ